MKASERLDSSCITISFSLTPFAPIPIGLVLTLIHLISIPVTNTSVNPARSTGPALFVGGWAIGQLWLFWLAPIAGGVLGGLLYRSLVPEAPAAACADSTSAYPSAPFVVAASSGTGECYPERICGFRKASALPPNGGTFDGEKKKARGSFEARASLDTYREGLLQKDVEGTFRFAMLGRIRDVECPLVLVECEHFPFKVHLAGMGSIRLG